MIGSVLVTGGCGFIGSNLVQRLAASGIRTTVLDLNAGQQHDAGIRFVAGDIRDRALCRDAMNAIDAVVHLAAESGIPPSVEDPETNFSVNVNGTLSVLLAAKDAGVRQLILA